MNSAAVEAEKRFMLKFAEGAALNEQLAMEQLRCLWTAYCFHADLNVDTRDYDVQCTELWHKVTDSADAPTAASTYADFEMFMCVYLV